MGLWHLAHGLRLLNTPPPPRTAPPWPVGKGLSSWKPKALHCPLDGAEETIEHALTSCRFLPFALDTISKCFLPVSTDSVTVTTVQQLFASFLDSTFELPAGRMVWLVIKVFRDCRCQARVKVPTWHQFMHLWISSLQSWTKLQHSPISSVDLKLFIESLSALLNDGKLIHPNLPPLLPNRPVSKAQARRHRKFDHAVCDSQKPHTLINDLEAQGYHIIYTDGSSEKVAGVDLMGGYGIFCDGLHAIGAHLPPALRQTNNTAELYAAIQAIKLYPAGSCLLNLLIECSIIIITKPG